MIIQTTAHGLGAFMNQYNTIAEAEGVLTAAGFVRDKQRHLWVNPATHKTAKVTRMVSLWLAKLETVGPLSPEAEAKIAKDHIKFIIEYA